MLLRGIHCQKGCSLHLYNRKMEYILLRIKQDGSWPVNILREKVSNSL